MGKGEKNGEERTLTRWLGRRLDFKDSMAELSGMFGRSVRLSVVFSLSLSGADLDYSKSALVHHHYNINPESSLKPTQPGRGASGVW